MENRKRSIKALTEKLNELKSEDKFYIFGAGLIGKLLLRYLRKTCGKTPLCFLVSDPANAPTAVCGVPVCGVNENIRKNIMIIVAMLPETQGDIVNFLELQGFCNIVGVDEAMIPKMRKEVVLERDEAASQKLRLSEMISNNEIDCQNTLVVSDYILLGTLKWYKPITVVSTSEFLDISNGYENYNTIIIFLLDWKFSLKDIVKRAGQYGVKIFFSLRSRYMSTEKYDFVKDIKKRGYQITEHRTFFRPEWEYNTEDILVMIEKRTVSSLKRDQLCTGCGMCVAKCPGEALTLQPDVYGNYKPVADIEKCIECGNCIAACPVYHGYNQTENKGKIETCYAYMAESEVRRKSSSGGAFSVLAEAVLQEEGYVCGAAWNEQYSVEHIFIHDKRELVLLQRSKYLRSDISNIFQQIYSLSQSGKQILFSGCPCQVAAVKEYLGDFAENVLFVDLLCTQAPSDIIFKKYLEENYNTDLIENIGFREKSNGWRPESFYITWKNGQIQVKGWEDSYQKAYHNKLMMPVHCEHCAFSGLPRIGDITIGDFWGIEEHDAEMDDTEGTSVVIINTEKGTKWEAALKQAAVSIKKEPIEWVEAHNRIWNRIKPHASRDRFYEEVYETDSFNKTVNFSLERKFDIALAGNWSFPNYGTELTYYALYYVLKQQGYSVGLIEWPEDSPWKPYGCTQLFQKEPYKNYEIADKAFTAYSMRKYNGISERFLHGSDQLLSPLHYWALQKSVTMPWVDIYKTKIGYAFSFGKDKVAYDLADKEAIELQLKNFDAVSVREESAVEIMNEIFEVQTPLVLDPVFLPGVQAYEDLMSWRGVELDNGKYLLVYILDYSNERIQRLKELANQLHMEMIIIMDAEQRGREINLNGCRLFSEISVNQWLYLFKKCECIVTDSFHGTCLSIIFRKKFVSIVNERRGSTRFVSLMNILGISKRMVSSFAEVTKEKLWKDIDYLYIEKVLEIERQKSMKWLLGALEKKKSRVLSQTESVLYDKCNQLEKKFMEIIADMGEGYGGFF